MALINCPECKKEISDTAAACPGCGAPVNQTPPTTTKKTKDKSTTFLGWFALGLLGFIVLSITLSVMTSEDVEETPAQKAERQQKLLRHNRVVVAGTHIKRSLRDPDSIKWEKLLANKNATVLCLKYQAKNGIGLLVRQYTVFVNGKPETSAAAWSRHCVNNEMFNMALAKYDMN